ncbi:MAG: thioesterase family protein [Phycisphaerales bacterium]|nr:thioesterase family protein [Phycisphaerales bacterium]
MADIIRTGTMDIRVRYVDCDPMGVVHHSVYPVWLEMGRTELLRETGTTYREMEEAGALLAVIELCVKYRQPAKYDDLLQLTTEWHDSGRVKIRHVYTLKRGDDVLATAETTLACIGPDGRPQPLPELLQSPNV